MKPTHQASLMEHAEGTTPEAIAQGLPVRESGLSKSVPDAGMLPMIERLAAMPDFDVATLEKLIDMQERILDRNAAAAFNIAFAQMQPEIPTIIERKQTDKGKYAPREDIVEIIRPILSNHGFSLSFRTEWPEKQTVKVIGILTHREGHSRESEFMSAADKTGSKNDVQALGSAVEYGRRYTTTDLLNIASRGGDDDGRRAGVPQPPEGFDAWFAVLEGLVPEGIAVLQERFAKSSLEFKNYTVEHKKAEWADMKQKAQRVKVQR